MRIVEIAVEVSAHHSTDSTITQLDMQRAGVTAEAVMEELYRECESLEHYSECSGYRGKDIDGHKWTVYVEHKCTEL